MRVAASTAVLIEHPEMTVENVARVVSNLIELLRESGFVVASTATHASELADADEA